MNSSNLQIINAKIITPHQVIEHGSILVRNGKITAITDRNIEHNEIPVIDAAGKYVSPGFIDIHVHGGGGHDFMDNTVEAFLQAAETHARFGTTAMTPTTLSSGKEPLLKTIATYERADAINKKGSQFIGLHIEGPYFA